jgi:hypothetical protein
MPAVRAMMLMPLVHRLLEFGPVVALDPAADATAARVVRHQHHIAAGQRNERGQRGALVAALFLLDLDQQFLAFADRVADPGLGRRDAGGEIGPGDFLERQEAVAVFAVVDEAGFQRRLDARDDCLVDVALALFAPFDLDFVVEEFLSIDDCQPAFFGLCGIDQHPLHCVTFFSLVSWSQNRLLRNPDLTRNAPTKTLDGSTMPGRRFETDGIARVRRGKAGTSPASVAKARGLERETGRRDGGSSLPQAGWQLAPAGCRRVAFPCLRPGL